MVLGEVTAVGKKGGLKVQWAAQRPQLSPPGLALGRARHRAAAVTAAALLLIPRFSSPRQYPLSICRLTATQGAAQSPALPRPAQGFELPKAVYVEGEAFSVERNLLTPTYKLRRPQLLKRYMPHVETMYRRLKEQA